MLWWARIPVSLSPWKAVDDDSIPNGGKLDVGRWMSDVSYCCSCGCGGGDLDQRLRTQQGRPLLIFEDRERVAGRGILIPEKGSASNDSKHLATGKFLLLISHSHTLLSTQGVPSARLPVLATL